MKQLNAYFPQKINRLIEPFCGGGSVFLNTSANVYLANDKNIFMIKLHNFLLSFRNTRQEFYKQVKALVIEYGLSASYFNITVPQELKQKYIKTYYAVFNKNAYKKLRDDFNKNKENMLRLYMLLIYGFNHMLRFNGKGDFNLPVGNVDFNQNVFNALEDYFNFIEDNKIEFTNGDFADFIKNIKFSENDFVYLDPPYLISDCEYNKGWNTDNDCQLLELIDYLNDKGVKFALSNVFLHKGRQNTKLIEWAKKYNVQKVQSNYISYHDNTIKCTHEVLITNYKRI
jgi:DNA adenine methylase